MNSFSHLLGRLTQVSLSVRHSSTRLVPWPTFRPSVCQSRSSDRSSARPIARSLVRPTDPLAERPSDRAAIRPFARPFERWTVRPFVLPTMPPTDRPSISTMYLPVRLTDPSPDRPTAHQEDERSRGLDGEHPVNILLFSDPSASYGPCTLSSRQFEPTENAPPPIRNHNQASSIHKAALS